MMNNMCADCIGYETSNSRCRETTSPYYSHPSGIIHIIEKHQPACHAFHPLKKYIVKWKGSIGQDVWKEVHEKNLFSELQYLRKKGYNPYYRSSGNPKELWRDE
jgi:hypothetical protein